MSSSASACAAASSSRKSNSSAAPAAAGAGPSSADSEADTSEGDAKRHLQASIVSVVEDHEKEHKPSYTVDKDEVDPKLAALATADLALAA